MVVALGSNLEAAVMAMATQVQAQVSCPQEPGQEVVLQLQPRVLLKKLTLASLMFQTFYQTPTLITALVQMCLPLFLLGIQINMVSQARREHPTLGLTFGM